MFVKPGEGAVEGAAPVNNNGGIARYKRQGRPNQLVSGNKHKRHKRQESYYLGPGEDDLPSADGRREVLRPGLWGGPASDLTAGTATRPQRLRGRADAGRTSVRRRAGVCAVFPGPPAARLAAARGPPAVWFRFLFRRRGAGSTGRPDPELQRPRRARRSAPPGVAPRGRGRPQPTVRGLTVRAAVREVAEGGRASPPSTRLWTPEDTRPGAGPPGGDGQGAADRTAGGTPSAGSRGRLGDPRGASARRKVPEGRRRVGDESRRVETRPRRAQRWSGR